MGKRRFASAGTTRLELSEGDWVEVKDELSYGERQRLLAAGVRMNGLDTAEVTVDWTAINVLDMELWLVDWSFTDEQGKPVPVSADAIRALTEEAAAEIDAALTAHKQRAEKNVIATAGSTE